MLEQCQRESKDHNTLSTIYLSHVIPRLQAASEDITRLHKKVRYAVLHMFALVCVSKLSARLRVGLVKVVLHIVLVTCLCMSRLLYH